MTQEPTNIEASIGVSIFNSDEETPDPSTMPPQEQTTPVLDSLDSIICKFAIRDSIDILLKSRNKFPNIDQNNCLIYSTEQVNNRN